MSGRWLRAALLAFAALAGCAGCGFKGPLYLPERNATVVTHPASAAPVPARTQTPVTRRKDKASPAPPPPSAPAAPPPT